MDDLLTKIELWFKQIPGTITAFSGGIDSALVLFLSRKYLGHDRTVGVISKSESLKNKDYTLALDFARENDINLETIYTEELKDSNYNTNPADRCYFCKTHLYYALSKVKECHPNYVVLNGTNRDDLGDYRPGLIAAIENGVRSPLVELGINKDQVRSLAKHFGIPFWDKPSSPCLSSRIPYGNMVSMIKLEQIEKAEGILNGFGFNDVRVRHFDETCKIEVPLTQLDLLRDLSSRIIPLLRDLGFNNCIIEEEGLISGNLNRMLNLPNA